MDFFICCDACAFTYKVQLYYMPSARGNPLVQPSPLCGPANARHSSRNFTPRIEAEFIREVKILASTWYCEQRYTSKGKRKRKRSRNMKSTVLVMLMSSVFGLVLTLVLVPTNARVYSHVVDSSFLDALAGLLHGGILGSRLRGSTNGRRRLGLIADVALFDRVRKDWRKEHPGTFLPIEEVRRIAPGAGV